MRKVYMIRARLLGTNGSEQLLIWTVKKVWFWESLIDVVGGYMAEQQKTHPHLGFDLIEFKEV